MNTGAEMWGNSWMTLFVLELAVGVQFVALTREDHHLQASDVDLAVLVMQEKLFYLCWLMLAV